jgi:hypothetical protein
VTERHATEPAHLDAIAERCAALLDEPRGPAIELRLSTRKVATAFGRSGCKATRAREPAAVSATPRPEVPTLALKRRQAAQAVSLGVDAFDQYVKPFIRCVYVGSDRLYPVNELQRWLDESATGVAGSSLRVGAPHRNSAPAAR